MEEEQKEEIFQSPPEFQSRVSRSTSNGSSAKKYISIIIFIVVIVLILLGVFQFFQGKARIEEAEPTPEVVQTFPTDTPTPTPEEEATPTPKATSTPTPKPTSNPIDSASGLDRSKLSIRVLNGSGITGAAKKASDFLEGLGYNVTQIGNAENSDYQATEIQISAVQNKYLDLLKKDLSTNYTIGKTSNQKSASESADTIVIIGK